MTNTFDQGKEEVAKLCQYFATNRQAFLARNEAQVRQWLIDPLFEALGWDVSNKAMTAPQYREIIPEDSLDVEGHQKAPDYTFRVGTLPKFYAEAKKCGVNIGADPAPAFQLRRYGWSAKLALSILTDFEEFGVYDCTTRPRPSDKASHARIQYFRCDEYPDRWRELWDVFSREAVWSGAFDQYAASKRKRGTSEVDVEFLKEIEGWRLALAGNIALRNKDLSLDDLNTAVQVTIDRVVFLRMAEDRGLEPYEQLLKLCERPEIYPRFIRDLCRQADQKYNSGLFHFHKEIGGSEDPDRITTKLAVDDKVFKPILESLYFAHGSPYHFGVLPVEILGTVYERFLGKVIRLTAGHQAKVEDKPEVRKAGGVYYTPAYIVEYIVKHAVAQQIEGRSPAQLAGGKNNPPFRVLDMACGSGSFLLGAYRCLLDYCLNWYIEHKPENLKKAVYQDPRNRQCRLTVEEKKRILTTHIFGVDIDLQAVEVTKLSLLLKVLEGETDQSLSLSQLAFGDRALPNLADNIKCGNSLIGPDYFTGKLIADPEEIKHVNPLDWNKEFPNAMKVGGFDSIIGNPPYGAELSLGEIEYLRGHFVVSKTNPDSYALFMEQAIRLLMPNRPFSMIVPTGWYSGPQFRSLRRLIAEETDPRAFVNLPYDVFDAWVDTTIFVAEKRKSPSDWCRPLACMATIKTFPKRHRVTNAQEFEQDTSQVDIAEWFKAGSDEFLTYADSVALQLIRKVHLKGQPLGEIADVQRGVTPFKTSSTPTHKTSRPAFVGTVRRFSLQRGDTAYIRFDDTLAEPKPERYFVGPRLLLRELISRQFRLQAARAEKNYVTNKSMQSILRRPDGPDLEYILGILNSRLMSWYFLRRSNIAQRDDFPKIVLKESRSLPIAPLDLANLQGRAKNERMVKLVEGMLALHTQLATAKSAAQKALMQRQIDATDAEIDRLVYDLYGLTAEEIAIVEGER
jgi:type I restriction-modification system DNA methylase subunit